MNPAEDGGMITALSTGEPGVLAHARAVLEEAGIPYGIEGEVGQLIYGAGNIAFGPLQIRIPAEEAGRVEKLFTEEGILQEIAPAAEEEPPQSSEKMIEEAERLLVASLLIFAAILAPPAFLKAWQARAAYRRESSRSGRLERRIRIVLIGSAFLSVLSWGALLGALANKLAG
jgi:hypothetical protein